VNLFKGKRSLCSCRRIFSKSKALCEAHNVLFIADEVQTELPVEDYWQLVEIVIVKGCENNPEVKPDKF
jgi:ornithine--oxo-acid transaminase